MTSKVERFRCWLWRPLVCRLRCPRARRVVIGAITGAALGALFKRQVIAVVGVVIVFVLLPGLVKGLAGLPRGN
jgi:hypothetical protein